MIIHTKHDKQDVGGHPLRQPIIRTIACRAKATGEIEQKIKGIQESSQLTASAIKQIANIIMKVSGISTSIAAAVEEQSAATREVSTNITGVRQGAQETGDSSANLLKVSDSLSIRARELGKQITEFTSSI